MSTSGSYSFTVSRDDIVNAALRGLKVLDSASTASSIDLTNCGQALNLILKQWADEGAPLWAIQWVNFTTVAGKTSYSIGPSSADVPLAYRPTRIVSAYIRNITAGTDTTVQMISRQEYEMLGLKTSQGIINQIYYDAQLPNGVLYCANTPVDTNSAVYLSVQRPIQDVINGTDNFDLPQEWFLPLKWCLMEEVATEYSASAQDLAYIMQKAAMLKKNAFDWQQEETSVFFSVDPQSYYLGRR
jgi:hypothetical protein